MPQALKEKREIEGLLKGARITKTAVEAQHKAQRRVAMAAVRSLDRLVKAADMHGLDLKNSELAKLVRA